MKLQDLYAPNLPPPTGQAAQYLERLVRELDVPVVRYEEARRRYDSVGRWLCRDESTLKDLSPDVYVQGSFRLGTPIRPVNDDEHYDIDLVCELSASKDDRTQQQLKQLLGHEMKLYAKAYGMQKASESRRCWTLDYAEGAQFHLDALPAIPDGQQKRQLLVEAKLNDEWAATAIAITDIEHHAYQTISQRWPHSNPRGFTEWFRSRMVTNFRQIREAMAIEAKASVEDVPSYTVKTPLQQAVQLLKRHRDLMFADDPEHKPISVIITTLAGLAYLGERTVAEAIRAILERLEQPITRDAAGVVYIPNPTDPQENFADRWKGAPEKRLAFFKWQQKVREDFAFLATQTSQQQLVEGATRAFGQRPARAAANTQGRSLQLGSYLGRASTFLTPSHKQLAPWPPTNTGAVCR